MPLKLHYIFKYFMMTQAWGVENPMYTEAGFPFSKHNGIDCRPYNIGWSPAKYPVYCPADGFVVDKAWYRPEGGGKELWLISKEKHQIGDKFCHLYMPLSHGDYLFAKVGDEPKVGELIMIGDNTGFSTGPHTHWGGYRVNYDGRGIQYLDQNDANGSFDISTLFSGEYAIDKASLSTLIKNNMNYFLWYSGKLAKQVLPTS